MTQLLRSRSARTSTPRRAAAALALACLAGSTQVVLAGEAGAGTRTTASTVQYAPTDRVIANPSRGFYHHTETHYRADGSGYTPLDAATLRGYRAEGITQVLRVFYLEKYAADPTLDPAWLALVDADLDTAREAGVSVVVRFAYAQGGAWPYAPSYGDAPLDTVLAHIDQLTPVLRANSDVIATVQAGFIGLWGEWYYTDHFAADPANPVVLTDADWANRAAVVHALLDALPVDVPVQVRTMAIKQHVLGVPTGTAGALTAEQAFDGSDVARVGHHNDCFLASPDDYGTFLSYPLALDQDYLAQETQFVPMGGETCTVNAPRSGWASASAEMARYHYSYLNRDYHQDVLDSWGAEGLAETARRLGYRFVLEQSTVRTPRRAVPTVTVAVRNEGWAAPYEQRPARLVLQGDAGTWAVPFVDSVGAGGAAAASGPADARHWAPGTTTTISATPCGVPAGTYAAHLELPSAEASLRGNPDWSIRTANEGTWEAGTGWNDLGQTIAVAGSQPAGCTPAVRLDG
ncbi:DUF4832 domain-containing protein [Modestobacter roseus]|uniref:Uncharacterized protein DUF4874 n=1 Tax=Modestobacter roseus TaxID=1181884 RepID=A0A562IL90_9ACTN|nr:DUF4832 domain-containing protein [Modestobacter roseus]TWH71777.1 uncharacterized protein DUF4874 [Modestobacter roseus]